MAVAQGDGVVYYGGEVGVSGRFAVACKGYHVEVSAVGFHPCQRLFEGFRHLLACGSGRVRTVVGVESAFAVDAVEAAYLSVAGLQIDAERHSEPAAVYWSEDG